MSGIGWVVGAWLVAGSATGPLTLDVEVDPTIVVPTTSQEPHPKAPHVATVRVTLTNVSDKERRLTFGGTTFLGYEVETADGTAAPRDDGGTGCLGSETEVVLAPGQSETRVLVWTARAWNGSFRPLAPGKYKVYGTMGKGACGADQNGHSPMRTAPVTVEVRPAAN